MSGIWGDADRVWLRQALSPASVDALRQTGADALKPGKRLRTDAVCKTAMAEVARAVATRFAGYAPVRIVAFNKTNASNWRVPWHQDRVIVVRDRFDDVPGFKNWSCKDGAWHCEPPEAILADMLFVRIFLDACSAANGGMVFAVGSHRDGLQRAQDAASHAARFQAETEVAAAGDILVLPMLTLHRSGDTAEPESRRVLRVDFAASPLPAPLAWAFESPFGEAPQ